MLPAPKRGQSCTWIDDDGIERLGTVHDWDPAIPDLVWIRPLEQSEPPTCIAREDIQPGWAKRPAARHHIEEMRRKLKGPEPLN